MPRRKTASEPEMTQEEIARRRDETVKRMIKMAPKTLKGTPKRGQKQPAPK